MLDKAQKKSRFESIGLYLPERVQSTSELMRGLACEPFFDLEELTGIVNRRVCHESEDSFSLALKAAQNCLRESKYSPKDLEAVIYVSISRFNGKLLAQFDPAMSLVLKRKLGANQALNFDLANACAGMCTGTHVLDSMIRAGVVKNGMVLSGECITPIAAVALQEIRATDPQQVASLTVGDAATACILEACPVGEPGIEFTRFVTAAAFSELCLGLPSDERGGVAMYSDASALHMAAIKRCPRFLEKILGDQGVRLSDHDFFIPHQTAANAIRVGTEAIARFLEDDLPSVVSVIGEYGNTSSTSHFLALHTAIADKRIKQGDRVLFLVVASGLVIGAVSFTVSFLEAASANEDHSDGSLQRARSRRVG